MAALTGYDNLKLSHIHRDLCGSTQSVSTLIEVAHHSQPNPATLVPVAPSGHTTVRSDYK